MTDRGDLERLADLQRRGILSDEAYEEARRRVLADLPTGPLSFGEDLPDPVPTESEPGHRAPSLQWRPAVAAALAIAALAAFYLVAREWRLRGAARDAVAAGDLALVQGAYAAALGHYREARDRWSGVPLRPERLAFAEGGAAEEAALREIASADDDAAVESLARALAFYEAADAGYLTSGRDDAVERAALAARIAGANASRAYALGRISLRDGDTQTAVAHFERALTYESRPEIESALAGARARLAFEEGQERLRAGDLAGAYERFRAALELESLPEYAQAMEAAARGMASAARSSLEQGLDALQEGDYGRAAELLSDIPRSAGDAFATAQAPLSEARRRLEQALGRASPGDDAVEAAPSLQDAAAATLYARHYGVAGEACRASVELALSGPFRWTDGLLGRKFPDYAVALDRPGVLSLRGSALELQGADGEWRTASYACDYDTEQRLVLSVDVR